VRAAETSRTALSGCTISSSAPCAPVIRARAVVEPRAVLAECGTIIPDDVEIRVSDSTAMVRYLVLPRRPQGTEGWTEEAQQSGSRAPEY
jgi:Nitrile hydratase, alpha chain